MNVERYFIIGIDTIKNAAGASATRYRVTKAVVDGSNNESSWAFSNYSVGEAAIVDLIRKGASVTNAIINEKGELSGSPASFTRFETGVSSAGAVRHPLILVAELVSSSGVRMGYKVIDYSGKVVNMRVTDVKKWVDDCASFVYKKNGTAMCPFQNVIVRGEDGDGMPIIAAYPHQYIAQSIVTVGLNKAKSLNRPKTTVTDADIEKKISQQQTVSKYSDENKKLIIQARDAGLNIRPLLNPEFTKNQLVALINSMRHGVNISAFAKPQIPADYMNFCSRIERFGYNCNFVVDENLNPSQRVQVLVGLTQRVDVSKYAKKGIPATEMEQIRMRMANDFWGNNSMLTDDKSNTLKSFKSCFD